MGELLGHLFFTCQVVRGTPSQQPESHVPHHGNQVVFCEKLPSLKLTAKKKAPEKLMVGRLEVPILSVWVERPIFRGLC